MKSSEEKITSVFNNNFLFQIKIIYIVPIVRRHLKSSYPPLFKLKKFQQSWLKLLRNYYISNFHLLWIKWNCQLLNFPPRTMNYQEKFWHIISVTFALDNNVCRKIIPNHWVIWHTLELQSFPSYQSGLRAEQCWKSSTTWSS